MGPATEIRLLLSIRHWQAHICNTVCSFGPPKTQEISRNEITPRDGPSKTIMELLYLTHRSSLRARFAHPEKRKLWELTVVIHNLTGTGTVRPDFRGAEQKDKKVTGWRRDTVTGHKEAAVPQGSGYAQDQKKQWNVCIHRPAGLSRERLSKLAVVPARC